MATNDSYDRIGVGYSRHRHADPRIESLITTALADARRVVNVGAGSGSYEPSDRIVLAVEPSKEMARQRSTGAAPCIRANAERLPLADQSFDAAMGILTIHHWADPEYGLRELARVGRRIVLLTYEPAIHWTFWLWQEYVPRAASLTSGNELPIEQVASIIGADRVETVLIPHDCSDGFGLAYWRRPHAYLDPEIRQCISGLARLSAEDVEPGLSRLRQDLDSGRWQERHRDLLELDTIDGGLRLIVRERQ
jgi:SAM-dependent methyltransferase